MRALTISRPGGQAEKLNLHERLGLSVRHGL
jgi:hypothetical protein